MVSITDITTNVETTFDSLSLAAKSINAQSGQISLYFSRNQVKPFKNRYIFKLIDKPVIGEKIKEVESWRTGVKIEVLDLKNNVTTVYPSIRDTARSLNIVHSTVQKYIKLGVPYLGTYVFKKGRVLFLRLRPFRVDKISPF